MEYVYSSTTDKIIATINTFRESGKGTAGTKKAVDNILVAKFKNNDEANKEVERLTEENRKLKKQLQVELRASNVLAYGKYPHTDY